MNPLGVHFIPTHTGQHHYNFIRDMQPGILKIAASSTPDVQQIVDGYAAAPSALIYLRNVARSEQHDFLWRDPVGAARQHVKEWDADIKERYAQARDRKLTLPPLSQIRILGVNEPVIELFAREEDMSNYDAWLAMMNERAPKLDTYMDEFGNAANELGYGTGLGNISSGQPADKRPGEYATFDWFPKTRRLLESTRGLNAYGSHEYWRAETGPEGHADWHAWRFMHLDVDCDIDVLESGVDQKITDADPDGNRGWHGHMDAKAYVDQHRRYLARACQDSRFRGATPFTLDGDKIWESFWVEDCMPEMIALSNELHATVRPTQPATKPVTVHLPSVSAPSAPVEVKPMATNIIEPRVAQAILKIESGGRTHGDDGRIIVRFEPHIFARYVTPEAFVKHFQIGTPKWNGDQHRYRDDNGNFVPFHGNQVTEYRALNVALELNSEGALKSTSMGAGQIMGFNHARVGFPTAAAMFQAFQDATMQAVGFMNYFLSDPALMDAMWRKDWRTIAALYNGTGAVDTYAPLLERAYNELGG